MPDKEQNIDQAKTQAQQEAAQRAAEQDALKRDVEQRRGEVAGKSGEVLMSDKPEEVGKRMSTKEAIKQYDEATGAVVDGMGKAIAQKEKWDPLGYLDKVNARHQSRAIAIDKLKAERNAQQVKMNNLKAPDDIKAAEFQAQLAAKREKESQSNSQRFVNWLTTPFKAFGDAAGPTGRGLGEGIHEFFSGLFKGPKDTNQSTNRPHNLN